MQEYEKTCKKKLHDPQARDYAVKHQAAMADDAGNGLPIYE